MSRLRLEGVTVRYGALRAVDSLELEVSAGEIRGLVGPNGSGKSTLLNSISGLTSISEGQVSIDGRNVTREPPHSLARIGVARTFQLVRLLGGLTVADNVYLGTLGRASGPGARRFSRGRHARRVKVEVQEAMERTGVARFGGSAIHELPFGVQRRVEVARAIVARPDLLLLDEPAAGLSLGDLEDLGGIIQEEAARGCAVILVDHHLHFVVEHCPRTVVLNFGELIYEGSSDGLVQNQAVKEAYVGV